MKTTRRSTSPAVTSTFLIFFLFLAATPIVHAQTKTKTSKVVSKKLPLKAAKKRTFLDFTTSSPGDAVVFKSLSPLNKALVQSDRDLESSGRVTEVRSRAVLVAPLGDVSEPLSALQNEPPVRPSAKPPVQTAVRVRPNPVVPSAPKPPTPSPLTETAKIAEPTPTPVEVTEALPPVEFTEALPPVEFTEALPQEPSPTAASPSKMPETTAETKSALPLTTANSDASPTSFFLRTGYLSADYGKYDDRMSNGATMLGFASSRAFETSLGHFEGRAAIDIFHATDQSVSVANVRMLSLRADVTRWLTSSKVKPGLSLGAGWAESSIRSYRSSQTSSSPDDVTVRTHAEGQSFSIIPSATLRVELSKQFKVDLQAEYIALFGGEAAEASRGAAVTISFGWTNF